MINTNSKQLFIKDNDRSSNNISVYKLMLFSDYYDNLSVDVLWKLNKGRYTWSVNCPCSIWPLLFESTDYNKWTYKITGLSNQTVNVINCLFQYSDISISSIICKIEQLGGKISFYCVDNCVLKENLKMIDYYMDKVIGIGLLSCFKDNNMSLSYLLNKVTTINPLKSDPYFYQYKIKNWLAALSLGFSGNEIWYGHNLTSYGYIVNQYDKAPITYQVDDKELFESFLLDNSMINPRLVNKPTLLYIKDKSVYFDVVFDIVFTESMSKENIIENLISAKGYSDNVLNIGNTHYDNIYRHQVNAKGRSEVYEIAEK